MIRDYLRKIASTSVIVCTVFLVPACGGNDSATPAETTPGRDAAASSSGNGSGSERNDSVSPQRAVVAETLAYAEIDEQLVKGHFVFPEDMVEPLPAVILIHEWWGLNDDIRDLADRIAAEGFIVLAIDLFAGRTATASPDARALMLDVMAAPEFVNDNIRLACEWLFETTGAPSVGTVGYGFGGGWSLNAASALPGRLSAAVIYYGQVSDNEEVLASIDSPILGMFGGADSVIPPDAVAGFEQALESLQKTYLVKSYPGAKGGFASPGSRNFNADLEMESWALMLEFLREHLTVSDAESHR